MKPPKRKRARIPAGYLPFPVFTQKHAGVGEIRTQFCCKAVLEEDGTVKICSPGDRDFIYQMGFYGKGSLSKHEPVFDQVVEQESVSGVQKHLQSASMERYRCSLHTSVSGKATYTEQVTPERFVVLNSMDAEDWKFLKSQSVSEERNDPLDQESCSTAAECGASFSIQADDSETVPLQFPSEQDTEMEIFREDTKCSSPHEFFSDRSRLLREPAEVCDIGGGVPFGETECVQEEAGVSLDRTEYEHPMDDWEQDVHGVWTSDWHPPTDLDPLPIAEVHTSMQSHTMDADSSIPVNPTEEVDPVKCADHDVVLAEYHEDVYEQSLSDSSDDYLPFSNLDLGGDSCNKDKLQYSMKTECLILEAYEAVFLKLAFNCLDIVDAQTHQEVLLDELWERCLKKDKSFIALYAVYHHFRAKGWVPKEGLTYGCDFMVYKKGPKYYHSSVGVMVRCCHADSLQEVPDLNPRVLTWAKLMGLARVLNNVKKELLICHVLIPADMLDGKFSSPEQSLRSLSISETLFTRIVPSRDRNS